MNNGNLDSSIKFDHLVKITIIGNSGVGKTSLLTRYIDHKFEETSKATIGVDQKFKTFKENEQYVKVNFCDTAGQERFQSLANQNFKGSNGVIIVYDITFRQSFLNLEKWLGRIQDNCDENVQILLVGNKNDLQNKRQVTTQEAKNLAKEKNWIFFEASALANDQVDEAFEQITKRALEKIIKEDLKNEEKEFSKLRQSLVLIKNSNFIPKKEQKSGCCW